MRNHHAAPVECVCGDHVFAPVGAGRVVLVSPEDAAILARRWQVSVRRNGYASITRQKTVAPKKQKTVTLAREIINPAPGLMVDHINRDPTDNRRQNLRPCNFSENSRNMVAHRDNPTGLKGAHRYNGSRFRSYIVHLGRRHYLGCFDTAEAAHAAYSAAAIELHGEFARVE